MNTDSNEASEIAKDWVSEADFAKAFGISTRTMIRYRMQKDGLPFVYMGGRVKIHVPTAREWVMKRMIHPNPSREGKRK